MTLNPEAPPHFALPDPSLQFLKSDDRLFYYRNLYAFSHWLEQAVGPYRPDSQRPVLIFTAPGDSQIFTLAACWLLQIPFVSLSPEMTAPELESALSRLQPAIAITDSENRSRIQNIPNLIIPADRLQLESDSDRSRFSHGHSEKLMGYFLTSGSTGQPKIVPLKRRQILYATRASSENFRPDPDHYWLLCLPLNHTGGATIVIRCLLYHACIYRMDRFDPDQIVRYLSEDRRFQVASMVPTMLRRLLEIRQFRVHLGFQAILLGGAALSQQMIQEAEVRGIPVVASYGMTETCGQIAANAFLKPSGIYHPKKSVGRIFPPNEAEIRDDDGSPLPANESGMLWLRGPQVFDGYLNEADNKGSFDDAGWFRTGDHGYLNRNDQLFIETRRSDLIVTGGENVNPFEVESALEELDEVRETVVIGLSDPEWGQAVTAFVISSGVGQPEEEVLREKLRKKLSPYKIPKRIIVVDDFPRTESGKINRRQLKLIYEQSRERPQP